MSRLEQILAEARARGLRPWIAVKERLAERAAEVLAREPAITLQGGGALRFVYGSPRLSADIDFAGREAGAALEQRGPEVAAEAGAALGLAARWSVSRAGRLVRGKVSVEVGAARRIVLPVESYDVPARAPRQDARFGRVEAPEEIAADKIVASADRLARRGTLKITDLFDLWFLAVQLGAAPPERALVVAKRDDYGQPVRGADLAAAVRAVPPEELAAGLAGFLPADTLATVDAASIVETAAGLVAGYADVL